MSRYNTGNAVPSTQMKDLSDNAQIVDEIVHKQSETTLDRFGNEIKTWYGIEKSANQAILNYGYITKDSFEDGSTISLANECLRWKSNGEYYRWDGIFPKVVPPGSTPDSTGGIGSGKWVGVGDASLRSNLASKDGAKEVGYGNRTVADTLPLYTSDWNINQTNTPQVNAQNLNTLIDFAIDHGRLNIHVDQNATIDDINVPVRKKTEVFFYQDGGDLIGLYRRASIPVGCPSNVRIENGVSHSGMMQFYRAKAPNVVIMGDSISTDGPNALSKSDCMADTIIGTITKQNPGITINFLNRAIGAQTWLNANTVPTGFPAWYTNHSKPWLDYVKEDAPDLLILAFGMNDSNGFNAGALHAVVDKINTWAKVPSILFITNPVPSMATTWNSGNGFYGTVFQEGRDWAAGYARTYAKFYGYSVLDINRQFCLVRDGRDYLDIPISRFNTYSQSYVHGVGSARDFSLSGDVSSWPVGKVLLIKVGSGSLDAVFITNYGGNFQVTAFCTGQSAPYINVVTTIPVTVGQTLDVSVRNNRFILFSGITSVVSFNLIRTGGALSIVAEWQDTPGSGPFASLAVNVGDWLQCDYTARDSDIWGHDDGTADTKLPEGGNGINHYSSKGISLVVAPVVNAFDFRRKVTTTSSTISVFNAGVTPLTTIAVTRTGNSISLAGSVSCSNAAPYKLFSIPTGYAPSVNRSVSTIANNGTFSLAIITVGTDGGVTLSSGSGTASVILDGVSFDI